MNAFHFTAYANRLLARDRVTLTPLAERLVRTRYDITSVVTREPARRIRELGLAENRLHEPRLIRNEFRRAQPAEQRPHALIWYPIGGCS